MKKLLTILLTAALLLSAISLFVLNTAAEEETNETSFKFGNATIDLTLIDNFNEGVGNTFQGWGTAASDGEMLKMELGGLPCNDSYGIKTGMLGADTDFTGAVNFVFSIKDNRSDGDIFFSFQPHSPTLAANDGNLFTGWVDTVWLVENNGKAKEAKKCPNVDLMSGRAGYILPMGFEGYIVFPVSNLVVHGDWETTYYTDLSALDIDSVGFHVSKDDATYAEFSIDDMFVCGDLPAYEAPTPETKPAETQPAETQPVETQPAETQPAETQPAETQPADTGAADTNVADTNAAETAGETQADTVIPAESDTTVGDDTAAESKADTTAESKADTAADTKAEDQKEGGCASSLVGGLCVLPLIALAAVTLRRREDE